MYACCIVSCDVMIYLKIVDYLRDRIIMTLHIHIMVTTRDVTFLFISSLFLFLFSSLPAPPTSTKRKSLSISAPKIRIRRIDHSGRGDDDNDNGRARARARPTVASVENSLVVETWYLARYQVDIRTEERGYDTWIYSMDAAYSANTVVTL